MKKRRFCRRWDVKINSQIIAQLRGFVKGDWKKSRDRIDRADMVRSILRPYHTVVGSARLFDAQGLHGLDAGGAVGGDDGGEKRADCERDGRDRERRRIP